MTDPTITTETADETLTSFEAAADKKPFLAQAQETLGDALNTVVDTVKERPGTAAAAVAGAAAAVAGAAYGVAKLRESDTKPKGGRKKA